MSNVHGPAGRRIVFTGKQQVALEPFDVSEPSSGEVLVRIEVSLMSTGTENIVFNRLFDPGTHFDRWVKYPFYPGYSAVGIVERTGADVVSLKPGDRVACRAQHGSVAVRPESECVKVPCGLSPEEAAWFALGKIAFHGAVAADYQIGDSALIIGAGPIGQMSIRWARAFGVSDIVVADPLDERMPAATAGGATAVIASDIGSSREAIVEACGGKPPRVVMDSTGNAAVFAAALGLVATRGRVVVLGDTGHPTHQTLTPDVVTRGLTVIGAHDGVSPPGWNGTTVGKLFFRLAQDGRISLRELVSHRFSPEQYQEAYETANHDRAKTMGILFDWRTR